MSSEHVSVVGRGGSVQLVPGVVYTAPPLLQTHTSAASVSQPYSEGGRSIFWLQGEDGGVSQLKVVDSRSDSHVVSEKQEEDQRLPPPSPADKAWNRYRATASGNRRCNDVRRGPSSGYGPKGGYSPKVVPQYTNVSLERSRSAAWLAKRPSTGIAPSSPPRCAVSRPCSRWGRQDGSHSFISASFDLDQSSADSLPSTMHHSVSDASLIPVPVSEPGSPGPSAAPTADSSNESLVVPVSPSQSCNASRLNVSDSAFSLGIGSTSSSMSPSGGDAFSGMSYHEMSHRMKQLDPTFHLRRRNLDHHYPGTKGIASTTMDPHLHTSVWGELVSAVGQLDPNLMSEDEVIHEGDGRLPRKASTVDIRCSVGKTGAVSLKISVQAGEPSSLDNTGTISPARLQRPRTSPAAAAGGGGGAGPERGQPKTPVSNRRGRIPVDTRMVQAADRSYKSFDSASGQSPSFDRNVERLKKGRGFPSLLGEGLKNASRPSSIYLQEREPMSNVGSHRLCFTRSSDFMKTSQSRPRSPPSVVQPINKLPHVKAVDVMASTAVERSIRNMEEHYDVNWTEAVASAHTVQWVDNLPPPVEQKQLSADELAELKESIRTNPLASTNFGLKSPLRNRTPGKGAEAYQPVLAGKKVHGS